VTDSVTRGERVIVTNTAPAAWRKSSYSGGAGNCVEIAGGLPGAVGVRDSKDPAGPALVFSPRVWRAFVAKVKSGGFGGQ
jgi:hypothetical protein